MTRLCRYQHAKIMLMVLDATMQIVWGKQQLFEFCWACHNFRQAYCIREEKKYCINCGTFLAQKNGWVQSTATIEPRKQHKNSSRKVKKLRPNVAEQQRKTILNLLAESPATIFDLAPLLDRTTETAYRYCSILET
jgi:hypothetical protein